LQIGKDDDKKGIEISLERATNRAPGFLDSNDLIPGLMMI
jgi:hypothetical protein